MIARLRHWRRHSTILTVYVLALILFVVTAIAIHGFTGWGNLRTVSIELLVLALVAAGQCVAIIGGGIDLSAPGVITGAAVLTAAMTGTGHAVGAVVALVLGLALLVGLLNGVGIVYLGVAPIVMTLATNVALSGAIVLAVGTAPASAAPAAIEDLAFGKLAGIPVSIVFLVLTVVVLSLLLTRTTFGRRLYSVGTSPTVSRFSGIQPGPVWVTSYVLSALLSAAAGLILLGYVGNAYLGMGDPYLFTAIAAVVVGGASALGGSGHYMGAFAGAILLTLLTKLLTALSVSQGALSIFYGLTILGSVWLAANRIDLPTILRRSSDART